MFFISKSRYTISDSVDSAGLLRLIPVPLRRYTAAEERRQR